MNLRNHIVTMHNQRLVLPHNFFAGIKMCIHHCCNYYLMYTHSVSFWMTIQNPVFRFWHACSWLFICILQRRHPKKQRWMSWCHSVHGRMVEYCWAGLDSPPLTVGSMICLVRWSLYTGGKWTQAWLVVESVLKFSWNSLEPSSFEMTKWITSGFK